MGHYGILRAHHDGHYIEAWIDGRDVVCARTKKPIAKVVREMVHFVEVEVLYFLDGKRWGYLQIQP